MSRIAPVLACLPSSTTAQAGFLPAARLVRLLMFACGGPEEVPPQKSVSVQAVAPPTSERVTIDLSAGMPGQSHWRYLKGQDSTTFAATAFDDSSWSQVG